MKNKIISTLFAAVLLTGCATTGNAPQANMAFADALLVTATSSITAAALTYKPNSRPIIQGLADGFTLMSTTNQLSLADIEGQFTQLTLIGGTNNPLVALEMQNAQLLISAIGLQIQTLPTNQVMSALHNLAGVNATGMNRALAAVNP